MKKYLSGTLLALVLPIALLIMTGCAGSYGKLQFNPGLVSLYKEGALPKDYVYYYCGRSSLPYAVVGIDKAYGFNDRLWFKIQSEQQVYEKISHLSNLHVNSGPLASSNILDENGQKIGVWFSYYRHSPVRVDPETRVVTVFNPYNPNEDDHMGFNLP